MLNELVAYFDGQISQTEFRSLRWNMQNAKKRPNFDSAYQLLKNSYPLKVQQYCIETSDDIYGSQKAFRTLRPRLLVKGSITILWKCRFRV